MKHINNAIITLLLFILYIVAMFIGVLILLIGYIPCLILDMLEAYNKHKHMSRLCKVADITFMKDINS